MQTAAFSTGTPLHNAVRNPQQQQRSMRVQALFTRTKPAVKEPEPVAPPKKGLFSLGSGKKTAVAEPATKKASKAPAKQTDKAEEYKKRVGVFGSVTSALDFAEVRSKSDAELLYDAKYGKRGADGRMSREQYGALRRKIGGTAKDYWKDWVDVKGQYVEKGYVSTESASVPGLPFLVGTVALMLAALGYVVANTS